MVDIYKRGKRDGKKIIILTVMVMMYGTWAYADECNTARYVDNYDGTITDCRTGLIWLHNPNCVSSETWENAMLVAAAIQSGMCGLTDGSQPGFWRLPSITEFMSLVASAKKQLIVNPALTNAAGTGQWTNGNIFYGVQSSYYWSSTSYTPDMTYAWTFDMNLGNPLPTFKTSFSYVWPVRGGQSGTFGNLIIQ